MKEKPIVGKTFARWLIVEDLGGGNYRCQCPKCPSLGVRTATIMMRSTQGMACHKASTRKMKIGSVVR